MSRRIPSSDAPVRINSGPSLSLSSTGSTPSSAFLSGREVETNLGLGVTSTGSISAGRPSRHNLVGHSGSNTPDSSDYYSGSFPMVDPKEVQEVCLIPSLRLLLRIISDIFLCVLLDPPTLSDRSRGIQRGKPNTQAQDHGPGARRKG